MISLKRREYKIISIYYKLNLFAALILGIMEIVTYQSVGEEVPALQLTLSRLDLSLVLLVQIIPFLLINPIFLHTKERRIHISPLSELHFEFNHTRIHYFMLILLIANIIFTLKTGNGVTGGIRVVTSSISFLFNIIKVDPLFWIYYVCERRPGKKKSKLYWINIFLFIIFQLVCGWTGFIVRIAIIELFFLGKYKRNGFISKYFSKYSSLFVIILFLGGSLIYSYLSPLKIAVRYGMNLARVHPISYTSAINSLLSRFTCYTVTVAAVQNHSQMAALYQQQGLEFWEIQAIFAPLLPRFIMPLKEFRGLVNIVKLTVYPTFGLGTSSGYNILIYWMNVLESSPVCFLFGLIVFFVLSYFTRWIIYSFDDGSKDVDVLYFIFISELAASFNLGIFGYRYPGLLYTIPLLFLFGFVHIRYEEKILNVKLRAAPVR